MTIHCPYCNIELDAPDEYVGQEAECPQCERSFIVRKPAHRVAVPIPKKQGLKRYQVWLLVAIGIIVIASPCVWFFKSTEKNVDNVTLHSRMDSLPTTADTVTLETSDEENVDNVSIRSWMNSLPATADKLTLESKDFYNNFSSPKCETLYPEKGCGYIYPLTFLYPPQGGTEKFMNMRVTQTFNLDGMNGVVVSPIANSPRQRTIAVIVDKPRAIGDPLPTGVYIYYDIQPIQIGALGEQSLHLYVQSQVSWWDAVEILREKAKQEWQAKEDKRQQRLPKLDSFLGITFGSEIPPYGGSRYELVKENDKEMIYRFTPDNPLSPYSQYYVTANKKTRKIFAVTAEVDRRAQKQMFEWGKSFDNVRKYIMSTYVGTEEKHDFDKYYYQMRGTRLMILHVQESMKLMAIDTGDDED